MKLRSLLLYTFVLLPALSFGEGKIPDGLRGDWTLDLDSGEPAWLSIAEKNGEPEVRMRVYVGPEGPYKVKEIDGDSITFHLKPRRNRKSKITLHSEVEVRISDNGVAGTILRTASDNSSSETVKFSGKPIPPMPETAPDLEKVRFGERITLFNGNDLTGWRPHESDKVNGWSVQDGMLVNTTPKTDFSATGAYANLRTVDEYEDFRLHIEFLIGKDRNSGVYLRGMYEAQVVDRNSRMQGIQGPGAIFGKIAPTENAGKPGGEWQTYDLTLVDRHVTVVLNGKKVIDNQPVNGPTGGAIHTDPGSPGPIYLQGDHTSVKYRNIYLEPVVE